MLVIKPLIGLTMISNNTLLILKVWQVETMKTIRRISGRTLDMKAMTISSISSSEKNLPVTMISHIGHKTLRNKAGMSMVYSSSVHIPVATVMTCMELAVNSLDLSKCSIIYRHQILHFGSNPIGKNKLIKRMMPFMTELSQNTMTVGRIQQLSTHIMVTKLTWFKIHSGNSTCQKIWPFSLRNGTRRDISSCGLTRSCTIMTEESEESNERFMKPLIIIEE